MPRRSRSQVHQLRKTGGILRGYTIFQVAVHSIWILLLAGDGVGDHAGDIAFLSLALIHGTFLWIGAKAMEETRNLGRAKLGACAALVPFVGLCWLVSLPIGILALVQLHTPEVQAAFANPRRRRPSRRARRVTRESPAEKPSAPPLPDPPAAN